MAQEQLLSQTQQQRLQMILAPQLRQSLNMLQVPILELRTLIQEELQQNPTIEEDIKADNPVEVETDGPEDARDDEMDFSEEFEVLARLDDEWREYFQMSQSQFASGRDAEARREYFFNSITQQESLQEHLREQLALADLDQEDHRIGELLIGSIDDDGYCTTSLDELVATTGYSCERLEHVLEVIQDFDPIGVGARDLRECLLLQLERIGKGNAPEAVLVRDHIEALGARKVQEIARAMKTSEEDVRRMAHFVATLDPRPGRRFMPDATTYVLPEVVVQKTEEGYKVIMVDDQIPHLRISRHYRKLMENAETPAKVREYIRDKVRSGAFMIKSIRQRQDTIYRIACSIVRIQNDFLDHGVSRLRPLTMAAVADELGIHETTVSRAIANKYMETPRGVFEMKYFFTPGYTTSDGQELSNKSIKEALQQLVDNEDPSRPLSDRAIVEALQAKGIKVARRTIAKYRESLNILPSHIRKKL